ncbi:MAG: redoxin domain-containing protein [Phycisphaera sp.]|nr:redoxin domain-containing protein [Phycisphaera sp.]
MPSRTPHRHALVASLILASTLLTLTCTSLPASAADDAPAKPRKVRLPGNRPAAPAFPDKFNWLNTDQPLALDGNLKGHVVILDFWTYCCINCMHILPDLEYIEHKYHDQPVIVVGVHSAKFETEKDASNINQAIQRYRIAHPVLVDEEHTVWNNYGVRAWPTFMVIDPEGKVVGHLSGEGNRELLDAVVYTLLEEGREKGTLAETPLRTKPTLIDRPLDTLSFPGKIATDEAGNRLLIADSNHDRILVTDAEGKVQHVIGSGQRGLKDGSFAEARFFNPQGMAIDGDVIYVADTDNHALRKIDLKAGTVTTVAGTGKQAFDREGGKAGTAQGLSSPWDVALHNGKLYIAMAGTHQLWTHDLKTGVSQTFSGSGAENIADGPGFQANLAQPSGLTIHDGWLYFADSEVSAVRRASLEDGRVETLIGKGLFEFGHKDGPWADALLQHPLGVAALDGAIYVADTYNSRLRRIDLKEKTITTLYGGKDELDEPSGIAVLGGQVYVADTNHHRVVRFDPASGKATAVEIKVPTSTK